MALSLVVLVTPSFRGGVIWFFVAMYVPSVFIFLGFMGQQNDGVGVSLLGGLQRGAVRGYRRRYYGVYAIRVNVYRGGGFIVARLKCVGVFVGSNARHHSRYLSLNVVVGAIRSYLLRVWGFSTGQRGYLYYATSYYFYEATNKISLGSGSFAVF